MSSLQNLGGSIGWEIGKGEPASRMRARAPVSMLTGATHCTFEHAQGCRQSTLSLALARMCGAGQDVWSMTKTQQLTSATDGPLCLSNLLSGKSQCLIDPKGQGYGSSTDAPFLALVRTCSTSLVKSKTVSAARAVSEPSGFRATRQ